MNNAYRIDSVLLNSLGQLVDPSVAFGKNEGSLKRTSLLLLASSVDFLLFSQVESTEKSLAKLEPNFSPNESNCRPIGCFRLVSKFSIELEPPMEK